MTDEMKEGVKPVKEPLLRLEVGLGDAEGMDYSIVVGEGAPVTKVQPEYLEAVGTGLAALREMKERLEHNVLIKFIEDGREARKYAKRDLAQEMTEALEKVKPS